MRIKICLAQRSQRCAVRGSQSWRFPPIANPRTRRGVPPVEATGARRGAKTTLAVRVGVWVRRFAVLASLLLLVSCQAKGKLESNQAQVKVARVVSGQSLEVLGMAEQPNLISQVRLIGVDAPDLRQRPWGDEAKQELENLIGGAEKTVMLEFDIEAKDKIGRTLAYVWKDKKLLNEQIVKQGYALFVGRSPNHRYDQRLEHAQEWARIMGQGIWNPEKPMRLTPAEFRRLNR